MLFFVIQRLRIENIPKDKDKMFSLKINLKLFKHRSNRNSPFNSSIYLVWNIQPWKNANSSPPLELYHTAASLKISYNLNALANSALAFFCHRNEGEALIKINVFARIQWFFGDWIFLFYYRNKCYWISNNLLSILILNSILWVLFLNLLYNILQLSNHRVLVLKW